MSLEKLTMFVNEGLKTIEEDQGSNPCTYTKKNLDENRDFFLIYKKKFR